MTAKTARATCCCGGKTACDCPKCTGLECLDRPRFFSGQLLTETELNDQQAYVRAKNRLHNLHLHGWGVVCGLEVVCHECEGWVTVSPGYAIDPCGEDVIVCQEHPLNVMEMIRRCKEARRRRRRADCEPIRPPRDPASGREKDRAEHWCITLSYAEREGKPTTALRREACDVCGCGPGCTCSCACHGGERASGSGKEHRHAGPERVRRGVGRTVAPCEPTRIFETYCLEVCEAPEDYCQGFESEAERAWKGKLEECSETLRKALARMPTDAAGTLADIQLRSLNFNSNLGTPVANLSPAALHDSYCRLYDFLRELFRRNPGSAHCALLHQLEELDCRPPTDDDTTAGYTEAIRQPSQRLLSLLVVWVLDCVCWALLPPCSPCCPGEDELILACLTVRDGRIEHICNYSCRRWAGAFPPTLGGVHLGPIWPLLARVLETVCCGDLLERLLGFARGSDTGRSVAAFLAQDGFARPGLAFNRLRDLSFTDLLGARPAGGVNLATLVDRPPEEAVEEMAEAGVELTVHEAETAPRLAFLSALPAAERGDRLIAYARQGKVVGFARQGSAEAALVDQGRELEALREEVAALRRGGDRGGGPGGGQGGRGRGGGRGRKGGTTDRG